MEMTRLLALAGLSSLLASTDILRVMPDAGGSGGSDPASAPPGFLTLEAAVNSLDPAVDSNWTADGLPDVDVIESLTGNIWVSRGDINGFPIDRKSAALAKATGTVLVPTAPDPTPVDQQADPNAPPVAPSTGTGDVTTPPTDPVNQVPADGATDTPVVAPDAPPAATSDPIPATPPTSTPSQQTIGRHRIVDLEFPDDTPLDGNTFATGLVVKVNPDGSVNAWAFPADGGALQFYTGVRNKAEVAAMPDGDDKNAASACTWSFQTRT
jgi:hypothetical protein